MNQVNKKMRLKNKNKKIIVMPVAAECTWVYLAAFLKVTGHT